MTTLQKQAVRMVMQISDESKIQKIIEFITPFSVKREESADTVVFNRFGAGKGILSDPENFDAWDSEVEALFDGVNA